MYSEVLNCCMSDVFPTPGDPMTTTLYTGAKSGSLVGSILEGDTRDDHLFRLNKASFPGNKTTIKHVSKIFQNGWILAEMLFFLLVVYRFFVMEYQLEFINENQLY